VIIEDIILLIAKLPPGALDAVGHLVGALLTHDDPKRAAERAVVVLASERAADEALRKVLG
jgi:hypothetical protein